MNTLPHINRFRSGTVRTTPSQNTASIAITVRTALDNLYKTIYGRDSIRCILTQGEGAVQVAHVREQIL